MVALLGEADFKSFHKNWGQVHPFLLTDEFVLRNFGDRPLIVTSSGSEEEILQWDRDSIRVGILALR